MKDKRISNEEKTNVQLKESSVAITQLKARTGKRFTAEEKLEFYKSVQALRDEIRMQPK
jgi:hypothetical protein